MARVLLETVTETEATPVASVTGTDTEKVPFSYNADGVTAIEELLSAGGAVSTGVGTVGVTGLE